MKLQVNSFRLAGASAGRDAGTAMALQPLHPPSLSGLTPAVRRHASRYRVGVGRAFLITAAASGVLQGITIRWSSPTRGLMAASTGCVSTRVARTQLHDPVAASRKERLQKWRELPVDFPGLSGPYRRQDLAMERRRQLIDAGKYTEEELGMFAQEVGAIGARRYFVGTYVDFAENAFQSNDHFYEVILEDRPCWLYFDLEYCKKSNPQLDPLEVMTAFRTTLASFCSDELRSDLNASTIVELESSTEVKFSKHVIVKELAGTAPKYLAFENNAQVGRVVQQLVEYAKKRSAAGSRCDPLFVRGGSSADVRHVVDARVPVIDTSVYTRNRNFRVLFQSKFNKRATLQLQDGGCVVSALDDPAQQVLSTLVSFVPSDLPLFRHDSMPREPNHPGNSNVPFSDCGEWRHLVEWLVPFWDAERDRRENARRRLPATRPHKIWEYPGDRIGVSIVNNRYCEQKRRSHESNCVFFIADFRRGVLKQMCYDKECNCKRRLTQHALPADLLARFACAKGSLRGSQP